MCFEYPDNMQEIWKFVKVKRRTPFHDKELALCTKEINAILARAEKNNKDPKRKLAILTTHRGPFPVWSEYGAVGPYDDESKIDKALGFK
jgi:hypothetical protein